MFENCDSFDQWLLIGAIREGRFPSMRIMIVVRQRVVVVINFGLREIACVPGQAREQQAKRLAWR